MTNFGQRHSYSKPENLFEPRPWRTTSIVQICYPDFIREPGTQEPYHKTYSFWTNPDTIITTKDLEDLYRHWEGEGFRYYQPEEAIGQVWYLG